MIRTLAVAFMVALLFTLMGLMHFYVYKRTGALLGLPKSPALFIALTLLTILFPLAMILSRTVDGPLVRVLYIAAASWLGLVFQSFTASALVHLIQLLFDLARHPLGQRTLGWSTIGLSLLVFFYGLLNAALIRTTEITIGIKGLREPKVTIALLTDIHVGAVYGPKYLQNIVDRTNALNPNLVAIAGDLFDGSAKPDYRLVKPLEGLQAPAFFVTGNHEVYEGLDVTTELVSKTGVTALRNRLAKFQGLQIIGLDAPLREGRKSGIFDKFDGTIDPDKPSILLYHIPVGLEQAKERGIDLQLSGHTHNGQMFPFNLLMPLFYRFYNGYGRDGDFQIYVSHGVGNWGPPLRIGSRSEIIKIDIVPAEK
ncbi:metallophosphoesterase [candidate division TA06 bacterium]|nr:metallophosphoesterase [candidate division TA06 bacterium]